MLTNRVGTRERAGFGTSTRKGGVRERLTIPGETRAWESESIADALSGVNGGRQFLLVSPKPERLGGSPARSSGRLSGFPATVDQAYGDDDVTLASNHAADKVRPPSPTSTRPDSPRPPLDIANQTSAPQWDFFAAAVGLGKSSRAFGGPH